jgi:glutathione synthase/RimK-type ligase-like ATP-grasp enzyme
MNSKKFDLLVLPPIENIDEIIKNMPIKITKAYYKSLEFCFEDSSVKILHEGRDLKTFSFVWLSSSWETRDLATAVKLYLERNNIAHSFVEQSTSKITDSMSFVLNKIPYPNTYYVETADTLNNLDSIEKICGFPLIMKDSKGFGGNGLTFVDSKKKLVDTVSKRNDKKKYLFQKFIPNDYDWGILMAKNKIISAEMSYPQKGEFRNNTCIGAKEVFVEIKDIPRNIKDIALKAANVLNLQWSRADIIVDKITGLPYLLEVNRFPGITSGTNEVIGASKFVKTFLEY